MRNSQDAFQIKPEIISLVILWPAIFIVVSVYGPYAMQSSTNIPPAALELIGLIITFLISSILPLFYVWKHDKFVRENDTTFEYFTCLLQSLHFRYANNESDHIFNCISEMYFMIFWRNNFVKRTCNSLRLFATGKFKVTLTRRRKRTLTT